MPSLSILEGYPFEMKMRSTAPAASYSVFYFQGKKALVQEPCGQGTRYPQNGEKSPPSAFEISPWSAGFHRRDRSRWHISRHQGWVC